MRTMLVAAALIGAATAASPAAAGVGQCFDRFGRPWGGAYDTDYPNYGFINYVQRHGGFCRRVGEAPLVMAPGPVYRYDYAPPPPPPPPGPSIYFGFGTPYRYY